MIFDRAAIAEINAAVETQYRPGREREAQRAFLLCSPLVVKRDRDFIEGAIPIKDKKTGLLSPWTFNVVQRHIEATRLKTKYAGLPERYAILKARQWGVSRYWLGQQICSIIRTRHFSTIIIADEDDNAKAILEDGKVMLDRVPYKLPRRRDNRSQLYLADPFRSFIDIETAKADNPCRSRTYRMVHGTEPALWRDPDKKFAAINMAVPDAPGTVISYEGTGYGTDNWWYDFWWKARNGKNGYVGLFYPWYVDPDFDYAFPLQGDDRTMLRDTLTEEELNLLKLGARLEQIKWRRWAIPNKCNGSLEIFYQEYPSTPEEAFRPKGKVAFNTQHVSAAMRRCNAPRWRGSISWLGYNEATETHKIQVTKGDKGALVVWHEPQPYRVYCMVADTGFGVEHGDPTAICVLDVQTGEQVAEWQGVISPTEAGRIAAALGAYYNLAYASAEINHGSGLSFLETLKACHYYRICHRQVFDATGRVIASKLGWSTNPATRKLIFNTIRENLRAGEDGCKFNSTELGRELLNEILDESGQETHQSNGHDDRVIAWGIALIVRGDLVIAKVAEEEETKRPRTYDSDVVAQMEREDAGIHEQEEEIEWVS